MYRNTMFRRHKHQILAASAAGIFALAAGTTMASAKSGDIRVAGTCSASSSAELKVKPRVSDRRTEVEFEVDQNVVGATWHVTLSDNGVAFDDRDAVTVAPSGSFTVRGVRAGASGHAITAVATNAATGESCNASASV